MTDRDIILIEVARRGRDGDYAGASEVAALQSRASALEARPNITSLDDVPNVVETSPTTGQVLTRDANGNWVNATLAAGVNVREAGQIVTSNARNIDFSGTFDVADAPDPPPSGPYATVALVFAGSGGSAFPARSDHVHTNPPPVRVPIAAGGYMSSGTRALASTNVTLPAGISCVVKAYFEGFQMRGADAGACYYQLRITINGNARTSAGGAKWVVQGVPNDPNWGHHQTIDGTGAAITVSADVIYHSGGGFYTDSGDLVVEVDPAR
jgi:hypothetical protein